MAILRWNFHKKRTNRPMQKIVIFSLVFLSAVITGCKPPPPPPVDTHPANFVGKWKAELTVKLPPNGLRTANLTIELTTESNGSANFEQTQQEIGVKERNPETETLSGTWKQIDDYLIVERTDGGFVAFRISSQTQNQLTVFTRTGQTIQFNRIP
jgi:hypothetical protein